MHWARYIRVLLLSTVLLGALVYGFIRVLDP